MPIPGVPTIGLHWDELGKIRGEIGATPSRTTKAGWQFGGYLPAAEADAFTRAVAALAENLRVEGDGLTTGQRNADALAALVARAGNHGLPTGGGLPPALTLTEAARIAARDPARHGTRSVRRPNGGATVAGHAVGDATVRFALCCAAVTPVLCQPPGPGPANPGPVNASSALARIGATPVEPLAVGRALRLATLAQRKALQLRDDGCVISGCAITAAHTQPHHVIPWALDGPTDLDNLVSLCFVHHRQVELGRYQLTRKRDGHP